MIGFSIIFNVLIIFNIFVNQIKMVFFKHSLITITIVMITFWTMSVISVITDQDLLESMI